ncbi:beta-ketoacyl synthase [Ophiocordyceps camponoti-floridani]|uniref:Beta-ketoacyl synthase n=1 Tax=Ophiocordyceps camponoti-floridani TaxID=2030778 RepID=A0A8H4Q2D8_9HYPO|nr:beta-ketoacyl synthase [Ophiocordyceps camponoti-floridani]
MGSAESPDEAPRRRRRGLMAPRVMDLVGPVVKAGTLTGVTGAITGVGIAIAFDKRPVGSGFVMGCEWFALGSTYWLFRSLAIASMGGEDQVTNKEKVMASGLAGSAGGAVAGLMRGPRAIVPCVVFYGLLTSGGQTMINLVASRPPQPLKEKRSWLESKWLPFRKVTDEEYMERLGEKILRVEADIAICDERIARLKGAAARGGEK